MALCGLMCKDVIISQWFFDGLVFKIFEKTCMKIMWFTDLYGS